MTKRFRSSILALAALGMVFSGCYDDNELRRQLDDHEQRIEDLESAMTALENQTRAGALVSSITAIEGGWRIGFTGGNSPSIDILNGKDGTNGTNGTNGSNGADGRTPKLEVRTNDDGTTTLWVDYGDGWKNTGTDLTGPAGAPGQNGQDGAPGQNGQDGAPGQNGQDGAPGANGQDGQDGISPKIEVRKNGDGSVTVWYNATAGYPAGGWVNTGYDLSVADPVTSIVNNADGTVTINTNGGKSYTFERSSTAVRFEILTFDTVDIPEGETGEILFAVNPSTAWIPTGTGEAIAAWELDDVGKRETRAGYVAASPNFTIREIAPASSVPAEQGKYIATIECTASDPGFRGEYMVSLVLDTNKAAGGPVLVTSSPFALKSRYNGPAIRLTNAYNGTLYSFGLSGSGEATIDWGDGTRLQTVTLYPLDEYGYMPQNGKVSHTYSNNNERTIVITGADITGIQSDGSFGEYNNGTVLDVSGMTSLQHISCIGNNFTSLDVSGLDELRYLNCSYNYSLNSLNLDGCVALNTLWCNNNTALESLDVTHCPELKTLDCSHSALTSLKVAGLEKLESLSCHWNALTSLDVRVLPSLQKLEADYNQLEAAVVGEIIADLPDRTGFDEGVFKVNSFNGDIENPWSPITTADKAAASAKGWRAE